MQSHFLLKIRRFLRHFIPLLLIIPFHVYAQIMTDGARAAGLGRAVVSIIRGPGAVLVNPACLSHPGHHGISFYNTRLFGMRELSVSTFSFSFRTPAGSFGIAFQHFGGSLYREQTLALAWGRMVEKHFAIGTDLRTVRFHIPLYGIQWRCMQDIGCCLQVSTNLSMGLFISNLFGNRGSGSASPLPQVTRLGVGWKSMECCLLTVECFKDPRFPLEIRGGCEINAVHGLCVRCGFSSMPATLCGGLGLFRDRWIFDYGFCMHSVLGPTHQAALQFNLERNSLPEKSNR